MRLMTNSPWLAGAALSLLIAISCALTAAAEALPRLEADSVGGQHVVLPTDALGRPLIVLVAFGKKSESDVKSWARKLLQDHIDQVAHVYVVVVVGGPGSTMQRHVRKIVEDSAVGSEQEIESNVLISFDPKPWREVIAPGSDTNAGVLVCDAKGGIVFNERNGFTDTAVSQVEAIAR
jgi:hypothetical protein